MSLKEIKQLRKRLSQMDKPPFSIKEMDNWSPEEAETYIRKALGEWHSELFIRSYDEAVQRFQDEHKQGLSTEDELKLYIQAEKLYWNVSETMA